MTAQDDTPQEDVTEALTQEEVLTIIEEQMRSHQPEHLDPKGLASEIAEQITQELSSSGSSFFVELRKIVESIDIAKDEIAAIRPKELTEKDLPDAQSSLEIIIKHSEEAAGNIISCAEELMELSSFVPGKLSDRLNDIATRLFESSNFDDLNGQRIRKVIATLANIEARLTSLLEKYGENYEAVSAKESPSEQKDVLMNGPQEPTQATSQEEIDRILAGG